MLTGRISSALKYFCVGAFWILATCLSVAAQEEYGTVYLYREVDTQEYGTQIVILNPEAVVFLGDKEFLSMGERTWIGFKMPVGRYVFRMAQWRGIFMLDVRPNHTYYLRVTQLVYPNLTQFISGASEKTGLEAIQKVLRPERKENQTQNV
jgi:hypothetical protein